MKKNKVLVTGAKGFIGSEIVRFLEKDYEHVYSLENKITRENEEKRLDSDNGFQKVFAADITDREAVLSLEKIGSVDFLVHSAGLAHQFGATSREDFQKVNVDGTANVLELAGKLNVKHFLLISSVSVYGQTKNPCSDGTDDRLREKTRDIFTLNLERKPEEKAKKKPKEKTEGNSRGEFGFGAGTDENAVCSPQDFYAESKLEGENLARRFCRENGIGLTILRPATVIGEEDKGNFLHLIRAIDRRFFVWIGKGENHKSLVHREDVARACAAVLKDEEFEKSEFEVFNVSAESLPMRRIVEIVAEKLERKIPRVFLPAIFFKTFFRLNAVSFGIGKIKRTEKTIVKWLADDVYSAEKIKRVYGFEPQISPEKAIEREVEWYIANK